MAFTACQTNSIHRVWLLVTCTCFPQSKKLELVQLADKDQFFGRLQEVLRDLDQQEFNRVFQASVSRVQEVSEDNGGYVD
jgi:hypothetical protein